MHDEVQAIRDELDVRFFDVVHELLGEPNPALSSKHDLRFGSRGSLSVSLADRVWYDHEAGEGGDAIALVQRCVGTGFAGALNWVREWLGGVASIEPKRQHRRHAVDDRQHLDQRNAEQAKAIWRQGQPIAPNSIAARYFRERGITLTPPASLRFLTQLDHGPTGLALPAIVGAVQDPVRAITGIQRIYLTADGRKKAGVSSPKRCLGSLGKGAVRLAKADTRLGIAEGIETALSAMQLFSVPLWACLGASRMHRVAIPDDVTELHLFGDNDDAGRDAVKRTVDIHTQVGRRAVVHWPPDEAKDWNDALRAQKVAA